MLRQIHTVRFDNFFLEEAFLAIEVSHHLRVDFPGDVTLEHHDDVPHTILAMLALVMVADLCDQLEQQIGASFIVNFRLLAQLREDGFLRIVSVEIDMVAFDPVPVLLAFEIYNQQLVFYGYMIELGKVDIEVHKDILF